LTSKLQRWAFPINRGVKFAGIKIAFFDEEGKSLKQFEYDENETVETRKGRSFDGWMDGHGWM